MKRLKLISVLLVLTALPACSYMLYHETKTGHVSGTLIVEWYEDDKFLVIPHPQTPLTFTRFNGERIQPNIMLTDARKIPRSVWVVKNYSPWGYAPAYVIHDWLQHSFQCGIQGYRFYDRESAAQVLAEVLKTLMNDPLYGTPNKDMLYAVHNTVHSPAAIRTWSHADCTRATDLPTEAIPIARYTVQF